TTNRVFRREDIYGYGPPETTLQAEISRLLPMIRGPRVLDFGCGAGALVRRLRQDGHDAVGMQMDRSIIADKILPEARPYLTLFQGGPLPFPDQTFDCATAFEVLEHVDDYDQALRELRRVSRRLILSVPDMMTIPALHRLNVVPWHLLESTHVNFFTELSL